ncbi:MAG: Imidazoleglycerol-phosphate dehydratase (EC [uncultured Campylobacterales bacterium]|uniref:Imidazoleglycerol-phosphate dehydratase n=1 Tax=uncultured Campylobacterales bacterium TaxID=352960 RepID=A0A6S6T2M8_9BACT|nr:MAG: Imidazoleglycerol-phosphate dehydratase (EC [uncultured Campylobacterales bacterium]
MKEIARKTKETDIKVKLDVYGTGKSKIDTGVGFFDHMLEAFAKHSLVDLEISCKGDTHIDFHHSVEDTGIVIGKTLNKDIFPVSGIERFANARAILDEAMVECVIDVSNRPFLHFELDIEGKVGDFDVELVEEFFRAICFNAGFSMHLTMIRGKNKHHIIESAFKALALAFRQAISKNDRISTPSTKGVL